MSLARLCNRRQGDRFPRVSGDEPGGFSGALDWVKFSPRERG